MIVGATGSSRRIWIYGMEHGINRNLLHVTLAEFKDATRVFTRRGLALGPVLMAFENGYLSFESGAVTVVMHAEGEWQGRATFSSKILCMLAAVPPNIDPIPIAYAENKILIGSMTTPCEWSLPRQKLAQEIANPSLVDLLAIGRTLTRSEVTGTEQGKKIRSAIATSNRRIKKAADQLGDLDISVDDIRALVELRIAMRLRAERKKCH